MRVLLFARFRPKEDCGFFGAVLVRMDGLYKCVCGTPRTKCPASPRAVDAFMLYHTKKEGQWRLWSAHHGITSVRSKRCRESDVRDGHLLSRGGQRMVRSGVEARSLLHTISLRSRHHSNTNRRTQQAKRDAYSTWNARTCIHGYWSKNHHMGAEHRISAWPQPSSLRHWRR